MGDEIGEIFEKLVHLVLVHHSVRGEQKTERRERRSIPVDSQFV